MQNDDISHTQSGDSDVSHSSSAPIEFKIIPSDHEILQKYLDEFTEADSNLRNKIVERAMVDIYMSRSISTSIKKDDAALVCSLYMRNMRVVEPTPHFIIQKIKKWFWNRYTRPRRQYTKFTRKWSSRNAFYHLNRDEVLTLAKDVSGAEPGDPGFLGALQDATTTLWNALDPLSQNDYVEAAKEWSEVSPPKHIQSR